MLFSIIGCMVFLIPICFGKLLSAMTWILQKENHWLAHRLIYLLNEQHAAPTSDIEEIFCRLPLPYDEEEFKIDLTWKDTVENKMEPTPYVHIRRSILRIY
ncbi:Histone-lysine N-methyltransferase ASHR3 [Vitis vinifera]|uniref:Histone-lysine N-methyltransferase ASHR3 n=1 Tax=Vitis vinifera TaxID=29760 RepID=A0A438HVD5_VITVI|nr:Histone-lysine N-methyltransferase ASHR3 [Vitis vinifera]